MSAGWRLHRMNPLSPDRWTPDMAAELFSAQTTVKAPRPPPDTTPVGVAPSSS